MIKLFRGFKTPPSFNQSNAFSLRRAHSPSFFSHFPSSFLFNFVSLTAKNSFLIQQTNSFASEISTSHPRKNFQSNGKGPLREKSNSSPQPRKTFRSYGKKEENFSQTSSSTFRELGTGEKEKIEENLQKEFPSLKFAKEPKVKIDPKDPHQAIAHAFQSLQDLTRPKPFLPASGSSSSSSSSVETGMEGPQKNRELVVDLLNSPSSGPTVIKLDPFQDAVVPDLAHFFANPFDRLTLNRVVKTFAVHKDPENAHKAIRIAQTRGFRVGAEIYTSLISAYAELAQPDKAFEILKEMIQNNVAPCIEAFNCIMQSCVKAGQLNRAFNVLDLIQQHQLVPDKICYTTLINGCIFLGDYERGWRIYDACKVNSLMKPDTVTYSVLINACAQEGLVEKALNLFEEMERVGLQRTEVTYNSLLYAMSKRRDYYDAVFDYFEQMKMSGIVPTQMTILTALYASAVNGDIETGEIIFNSYKEKYPPDLRVYSMILQCCANALKHETKKEYIVKGEKYWEDLLQVAKPDLYAVNVYLTLYTKGLRLNVAKEKFDTIFQQYQVEPDLFSYAQMTKMYFDSRRYKSMLDLYFVMKEKNISLNEKYFTLLLSGFDKMLPQEADKLTVVLEDMIMNYKIQPPRETVTNLLKKILDLQEGRKVVALTGWTPPPLSPRPIKQTRDKKVKLKNFRKKFKV